MIHQTQSWVSGSSRLSLSICVQLVFGTTGFIGGCLESKTYQRQKLIWQGLNSYSRPIIIQFKQIHSGVKKKKDSLFSLPFRYIFQITNTDCWLAISSHAGAERTRVSVVSWPPACSLCLRVQLLTGGARRRKPFDQPAFVGASSLRSAWCVGALIFIQTVSVLCNHRPRAHRPIPEQRLAYVWALCSSTATQKAGRPCSHEGQVVSSGISPRLSHSLGDRCKQLHLRARLHYSSKERLSWTSAMPNKRGQGAFVCRFLLLLSYKKSWAQPWLVNRKWSLAILGSGGVCAFNCSRTVKCVTLSHIITTSQISCIFTDKYLNWIFILVQPSLRSFLITGGKHSHGRVPMEYRQMSQCAHKKVHCVCVSVQMFFSRPDNYQIDFPSLSSLCRAVQEPCH